MVFGCSLLPLCSVARLADLCRDAVCVFVGHEAAVLVLCLDIAVDEFHEKELFECHPLVEYLLCIVDREACEICLDLCIWI